MVEEFSRCLKCKEKCFLAEAHKIQYKKFKKEYFNENNCFQKKTIHKCQFKDTGTYKFYKNLCLKEFNTECKIITNHNKKVDNVKPNEVKIKERCICMNPKYKTSRKTSIDCVCYPLISDVKENVYSNSTNNILCNHFFRKKCSNPYFYRNKRFFNDMRCQLISNLITFEKTYFGESSTVNTSSYLKINETYQYNNTPSNMMLVSTTTNKYVLTNATKDFITKTINKKNYVRSYEETGGEEEEEEEEEDDDEDDDDDDDDNYDEDEEEEEEEEIEGEQQQQQQQQQQRGDIIFYDDSFKDDFAQKLAISDVHATKSIQDSSKINENNNNINNNYIPLHKTITEKLTDFVHSVTNESSSAVFFGSVLIVGVLFLVVCFYVTNTNSKKKRQVKEKKRETQVIFLKMHRNSNDQIVLFE